MQPDLVSSDIEALIDDIRTVNITPDERTVQNCDAAHPVLRHFGLISHPFSDNLAPEFFFRTEAHEKAYSRMMRCIEDDISIGMTLAPSGTGKTFLTQILLADLDRERYLPVLILVYPGMTRAALLVELFRELTGEAPPPRMTAGKLIGRIQDEIIALHRAGRKLVVIIDEAHFLRADCLHILRTLSNIEIPEKKLVTVLLFGEEVFQGKLEKPQFRSVLSRAFVRADLRPLRPGEVEQFVKFRLLIAAGRPGLFDPACMQVIFDKSQGIPREVNRLCHNALYHAAEEGAHLITPAHIRD
ncbi:MAG: ExeA family protein [Candidatus Sumerlaeia bacterium]